MRLGSCRLSMLMAARQMRRSTWRPGHMRSWGQAGQKKDETRGEMLSMVHFVHLSVHFELMS